MKIPGGIVATCKTGCCQNGARDKEHGATSKCNHLSMLIDIKPESINRLDHIVKSNFNRTHPPTQRPATHSGVPERRLLRRGVCAFSLLSGVESGATTVGPRCATCCAYVLKRLCIFRQLGHRWPGPAGKCTTASNNMRNTSHNADQPLSQRIPPQKIIKNANICPYANVYVPECLK